MTADEFENSLASQNACHLNVVVGIVSYKTARMVSRCLASLVEERHRAASLGIGVSVIVIDNASGDADELDKTVASLDIGAWTQIVRAPQNGGFAYGNNLVMRMAYDSGKVPDYFWCLNPDTEVRPNSISELVNFLENNPRVGIAGSSLEHATGELWPYAFRFPNILSELDDGLRLGLVTKLLESYRVLRTMGNVPERVDWLPGASMMIRRELVDIVGGMDESYFLYYEETDYCRRAQEAGWSTWYVPSSRVMHDAGGSTGVTTAREKPRRFPRYWYESRRRYFQKNFGTQYAVATDLIFAVACALGHAKSTALGRYASIVPHQIRDVLEHSAFLPRNRALAPVTSFNPVKKG